jgi:hypothetical protein
MKTYRRVKIQLCALLNPALYGGKWLQRQSGHCEEEKEFLALAASRRLGREGSTAGLICGTILEHTWRNCA